MARKGQLTKTITLPDGTRKWIYGKTEEELRRKLLDYQVQLGMGIDLKALIAGALGAKLAAKPGETTVVVQTPEPPAPEEKPEA